MRQTQQCHVCGTVGFLVEGRIQMDSEAPAESVLVAQCPRCKRFICSRHGEKLALSAGPKSSIFSFGTKKPAALTVCCPFDPGVALGDPD
jgi:hypothetical protein